MVNTCSIAQSGGAGQAGAEGRRDATDPEGRRRGAGAARFPSRRIFTKTQPPYTRSFTTKC